MVSGLLAFFPTAPAIVSFLTPAVIVEGGSPDRLATLDDVLQAFDDAGLVVPPVAVVFHEDRDPCLGPNGLYRWPRGERPQIHICARDVGDHEFVRHTIAHELGHVWADAHLDDEEKRAFVEHRRLEVWSASGVGWPHKGNEHAAEIIAWGVLGDPVYKGLPDRSCARLRHAYEMLIGEPPSPSVACDSGKGRSSARGGGHGDRGPVRSTAADLIQRNLRQFDKNPKII